MIPTARNILKNKETFDKNHPTVSVTDAIEAMIEFAKLHVTKALVASHINSQLPEEDIVFTLECYPSNLIK